jgi:Cytochrome c553
MRRAATLTLLATLAASPAFADTPSAARGAAVVDEWCRDCHLRPGDRPDPDMAPPYEEIVTWPGRDRAWFEKFLRDDHFPMTTYRLFDHEKADVVEWLLSLERK